MSELDLLDLEDAVSMQNTDQYTILIIDDEESIVDELYSILALEGFAVVTAMSAEKGLEILQEMQVHLIISDQKMGTGMMGTELLRRVKELYPDIVTMILSAYCEQSYLLNTINKTNAFQYILKPWDQTNLLCRVYQALQFYQLQKDNQLLLQSNRDMLRKMALLENFSSVKEFSKALYDRFYPILESCLKKFELGVEIDQEIFTLNKDQWSQMATVINRLGQIGSFYDQTLNFQPGSLVALVRSCVEEAKQLTQEADIRIEWFEEYAEDCPYVLLHADIFAYAVRALIENAVVFSHHFQMSNLGEVTIKVYREFRSVGEKDDAEGFVCLEVIDNGQGAHKPEKIFLPLYSTCAPQVSSPTMQPTALGYYNFSEDNHIGLGLTIAHWCLVQHGAVVSLENPGEAGAIFKVSIPVQQQLIESVPMTE